MTRERESGEDIEPSTPQASSEASPNPAARRRSVLLSIGLIVLVGGIGLLVPLGVPALNAVVVALLVGLLTVNLGGGRVAVDPAVSAFMLKRVLKWSVILLGAGIDVGLVADVGGDALLVISICFTLAIATAMLAGRWLGVGARSSLLIGVGTAICGASAIVAVASVLRAKKDEIGVALATILCFNALALVLYPVIGHALDIGSVAFGTWAGVGVHDAASAVAVGFALDHQAGEVATVVKLARTLYLIPLVIAIAVVVSARDRRRGTAETGTGRGILSSIPWFVFGFAALATLNGLGWLGGVGDVLSSIATYLIVFVVATIGLTLRVSEVARLGGRLFVTGFVASVLVGAVGLVLIQALDISG